MDILNKSLCQTYSSFFPIGAAVCADVIKTHEQVLKKHFNSVTAENHMKYILVRPQEGKWQFEKADAIVNFAIANKMKVRGHTLVWHNQVPDWVFLDKNGKDITRDALLARMKEYITVMTQRYKKEIYCWDVVNEAVEDKTSDQLRQSKWLSIIGPDFIEKAFEFARQANPDALLFYNDYNTTSPEKRK
jgi:endo-1,4-beta-xylanase